ncbi:MAG: GAF domain-containing protein [Anaerolineae bacterium]
MPENNLNINHLIELVTKLALHQKQPDQVIAIGINNLSHFLQSLNTPLSKIWLILEDQTLQEITFSNEMHSPTHTLVQPAAREKIEKTLFFKEDFDNQISVISYQGKPATYFPFNDSNNVIWGGLLITYTAPSLSNSLPEPQKLLLAKICQLIGDAHLARKEITQNPTEKQLNVDLHHVLQEVYFHIHQWLNPDYFYVNLLDPSERFLNIKFAVKHGKENTDAAKHLNTPVDHPMSLSAAVIRSKQSLHINDLNTERPDFSIFVSADDRPRSMLFAPLKYNGQVKGVISVQKDIVNGFTPENLRLLEQLATQIAMTLEIQSLYNLEKSRRSEAETLNELASQFIRYGNNKSKILDAAIEAIFSIISNLEAVTILSKIKNTREIVCIANDNRSKVETIMQVGHQYNISLLDKKGLWKEDSALPICYPDLSDMNLLETKNSISNLNIEEVDFSSIYTFGMESNGSIEGYIVLTWILQKYTLSKGQVSFIQNIANQTAIALDRIKFSEAERKQYQLARTLRDMGLYLTIDLSIDQFYDRLFDLFSRVVDFDSASLYLKNSETNQYTLFSNRNIENLPGENLTHEDIVKISMARFKDDLLVCCIPNTVQDETWVDHSKIKSWVGALIRIKGEVIGLLNVNSFEVNTYDDDITQTVLAFANHASIALESSRLYERLGRRINELSIINQFTREASHAKSIEQLVDSASSIIFHQKPDIVFGIGLIEESQVFVRTWTTDPHENRTYHVPNLTIYDGIVGRTLRTKEPQFVNDVRFDPDYVAINSETRSQICVPLQDSNDIVIGILNLESANLQAFTNNDLIFATTVADQLSGSIQRLQLHSKLQQYAVDLEEEVHIQTIKLREERDRIEKILQNAGEGIFFTNIHQEIIYTNDALCSEVGFTSEELIGRTPAKFMILPTEDSFETIFSNNDSVTPYQANLLCKHKDLSEFWVSCIVTPILDDNEVLTGHVGILANINSLIQAEQIKSRFITNVSHELRTPLTNIKVYLDLINRGGSEKIPRYLNTLDTEVKRLEKLIQDLLGLSIIDSGNLSLNQTSKNLDIVMQDRIDSWKRQFDSSGIKFVLKPPETEIYALFDQSQIISVRDHLLSNALNYSRKDDRVTLEIGSVSHQGKEMAFISVLDTGTGMTPRETGLLFDRFFRGSEAQSRQIAGAGLGLSITKEIVDRHHGDIIVQSSLGEGSTFTILLPICGSSVE